MFIFMDNVKIRESISKNEQRIIDLTCDGLKALVRNAVNSCLKENNIKQEQEEEFLSIEEAADFLKLKKNSLYCKNSRGEIPYIKDGKKVHYLKSDLINYLKRRRKVSNEDIENIS